MQRYEYKVIATPRRLKRVRGVKGPQALFAHLLTETMNEYAVDGWEYVRAENLPIDEKQGLFKGSIETYQSVLVFRRLTDAVVLEPAIEETPEPEPLVKDETPKIEDIAPAQLDEPELPADPLVQVAEDQRSQS